MPDLAVVGERGVADYLEAFGRSNVERSQILFCRLYLIKHRTSSVLVLRCERIGSCLERLGHPSHNFGRDFTWLAERTTWCHGRHQQGERGADCCIEPAFKSLDRTGRHDQHCDGLSVGLGRDQWTRANQGRQ